MIKAINLPPVSQLLSESWETTKRSWWGMLRVFILTFGIQIVLFLIGLIAVIALGVQTKLFEALSNNDPAAITSVIQSFGGPVAAIIIVYLIASFVINMAGQVAALKMVYYYKDRPSARDMFKNSFKHVGPLVVAALISGVLIMGGFFALIIPAIIFSMLFAFVGMEVVFNNQGPLAALKRSASLVSSHFGDVFLRWIVLIGISLLINLVFAILGNSDSPEVRGLSSLLSMIVYYLMIFFSLAYSVTLYRQVVAVGTKKQASLLWVIVVAVIGWLIAGFLIMQLVRFLQSDAASQMLESFGQSQEQEMQLEFDDPELERQFMELEQQLNDTNGQIQSLPPRARTQTY